MAVLGKKPDQRQPALKVRLVGEHEERRNEAKAILLKMGDPPVEIVESGLALPVPGEANGNGNGNGHHNGNGHGGEAPVDVVIVTFHGQEEASLRYIQALHENPPCPVIVALLPKGSPELMRRALKAGADELIFFPVELGDMTRALVKIESYRRSDHQRQGGVVVSVTSTLGGMGVTSLTANLALALRYTLRKRVAVIDLDLQSGGLSVCLNIEPERTIMLLIEPDKKLDSIQLESALTKHESGIYLLSAPRRMEDCELIPDALIAAVLDLMRQLFDFVLIDCGSYINEVVVAAWEHSDRLLYLLDQSITSARCAWRFIELYSRLGLKDLEPSIVLSRHSLAHPITEEQITHTLARPVFAKIPRDEKTLERVQLRAQDLWKIAPNAAFTRSIEELARRLAAVDFVEAPEVGAGLLSRLFSAIAARA